MSAETNYKERHHVVGAWLTREEYELFAERARREGKKPGRLFGELCRREIAKTMEPAE